MADDTKTPLPTMQLPPGASPPDSAPPLLPTAMPATGAPVPNVSPPPMPPEWRYAVNAEIARGGMGRVVEAVDTVLDRTVAVKEALSLDPDTLRRFQRETRITARLEHPSIIPVHDAGTSPAGAPFYVMRKVSGRPLEEMVAKVGALAERLALLPHIVAASHAIAHAHERGIVHRDIKPSNILVGDLGETIVIDWGLAKAIGEADEVTQRLRAGTHDHDDDGVKTRAGIVFGTPGFMAPEQLRGAPVDERCDVYALGATLYHLLARRPPHYHKQGDEMMRRAVAGPPEPLREITPGVPPELATIVDKALAHDARARYQTARALAEDLQRFLTGQLVASHHYSRRERLVRFVRKNRAAVGVSTAAVLALAIGGTIAVRRILNERRIALAEKQVAEEQREKVVESLQQLTLTTARTKAEDDPTRAVAMLDTLALDKVWRQARAIGAAARLHGIAIGLPASPHTLSLAMSKDGQRVLAAGDDGVVRVIDLATHGARELANVKDPAMARFADGERSVLVFRGKQLTTVDVTTGARRELATPSAIVDLEVAGPTAYWVDDHAQLWRLETGAAIPEHVDVGEDVTALATSPDGRWVAIAGADHILLLDRTQPTMPPQELTIGRAHALSWAADSGHLVALADQDVVAFEMPSGAIAHRQYAGERYAIAYSNDEIYTTAKTGISIVSGRDDPRGRHINGDYTLGLHVARGGTLVTGGRQGLVAVISPDDDELVHTPQLRIDHLEASPASPWVVAATDGHLLAWNLDDLEPRHLGGSDVAGAAFVSDDALVLATSDQQGQWVDLRGGAPQPLGTIPDGIHSLVPAPDGKRALLVDGTHAAHLIAPGVPAEDVAPDVDLAVFPDDTHLVIATSKGAVVAEDLALHRRTAIADHPAGVVALAARDGRVAAAFGDNQLWRSALATGQEASIPLAEAPPRGAIALARDGAVVFASNSTGGVLHVWPSAGALATLATFDKPIVAVWPAGDDAFLAITADGVGHLVPGKHGAAPPDLPNLSPRASVAPVGLVASTTSDGVLEAIDAPAGERWTLAIPKGRAFAAAQISPGGGRVLATTPQGVLVWTLQLPEDPAATARWLAGLTNAASGGADGALSWR